MHDDYRARILHCERKDEHQEKYVCKLMEAVLILPVSFIVPRPPGGPGIRQALRILTNVSHFRSTVHRRRKRRCRCTIFKNAMLASRRVAAPACGVVIADCFRLFGQTRFLNQRVTSALVALTALDHRHRPSDRERGAKVLGRHCVWTFYVWSRPRRPRHNEDHSSLAGVPCKTQHYWLLFLLIFIISSTK